MTDFHGSLKRTKKRNRSVSFSKVEVYYFDRAQGFVCVPSQGGSTLGMQAVHWASEEFSVNSHQHFRLLERYLFILKKYRNGKLLLGSEQVAYLEKSIKSAPEIMRNRIFGCFPRQGVSIVDGLIPPPSPSLHSEPSEEPSGSDVKNNEAFTSEPQLTALPIVRRVISCDELLPAEEEDERLSAILDCYFLPLLSIKKRRILLRRAGLKIVDPTERAECQAIRLSRDICGCDCTDGACLPNHCQCALNGIKCQVDRLSFPCPCTSATSCQNPEGRIEFNPIRVRTHYLHTRMRLEMERQERTSINEADDIHHHLAKRVRLNETSTTELNTNHSENAPNDSHPKESNLEVAPDAAIDLENTADGILFNTTASGGCRDCENDHYVHLLMQEFVSRTEEQNGATPHSTETQSFPVESVELPDVNSHHANGTSSSDVIRFSLDDETDEQYTPALITPELLCNEQCTENGHETVYHSETDCHATPPIVDSLPCITQRSPELVDVCPTLDDATQESLTEKASPINSFPFVCNHEDTSTIRTEVELTSGDRTMDEFILPSSEVTDAVLFSPTETVTDGSAGAVKCTLEPISSLFASCTAATSTEPAIPHQAVDLTSVESQSTKIGPSAACDSLGSVLIDSSSPVASEPSTIDKDRSSPVDVSCNSTCADVNTTVASTVTVSNNLSLPNRSMCPETEGSPRNPTPPSSPYPESVMA